MAINTPDHAGLQAVFQNSDTAPEVVNHSTKRGSFGASTPEVYNASANYDYSTEGYYPQEKRNAARAEVLAANAALPTPPATSHTEEQPHTRRIVGLRRRIFYIILGVVIALVVLIAAVVGGVVGSNASKNPTSSKTSDSTSGASPSSNSPSASSSASPPPSTSASGAPITAQKSSGLALLTPVGANSNNVDFFSYYIHNNGSIMEVHVNNSTSNSDTTEQVVVSSGVTSGSPIAAVSWSNQGTPTRQIFYIDANGRVLTTNTSDTGANAAWASPYNILTNDAADPNTPALAACVGTGDGNTDLDGMRIYYGSEAGYIQEVGFDFFAIKTTPVWNMWYKFTDSDPASGVGCVIDGGNINHVYLRNSTTGLLQQWLWNYTNPAVPWTAGAHGSRNMTSGANLAVANDGLSTDYIFYGASAGTVIQGAAYTGGNTINGIGAISGVASHSQFSATYDAEAGGTLVAYQAQAQSSSVTIDVVSRDGSVSSKGLLS